MDDNTGMPHFVDKLRMKRISAETVILVHYYFNCKLNILLQQRVESRKKVIVVDCRFTYEYEGGHIKGAKNIRTLAQLGNFIETADQDSLYVFHCEFSQLRGPTMYDSSFKYLF